MSNHFDAEGFYAALDAHRRSKGLTWKKVSQLAEVSASTLTRMGQGKRPDVDTLAALAHWSGIDVKNFYTSEKTKLSRPDTVAEMSALLRADKTISTESAIMLENMITSLYKDMRKRRDE